jgi:hypothetical protein
MTFLITVNCWIKKKMCCDIVVYLHTFVNWFKGVTVFPNSSISLLHKFVISLYFNCESTMSIFTLLWIDLRVSLFFPIHLSGCYTNSWPLFFLIVDWFKGKLHSSSFFNIIFSVTLLIFLATVLTFCSTFHFPVWSKALAWLDLSNEAAKNRAAGFCFR